VCGGKHAASGVKTAGKSHQELENENVLATYSFKSIGKKKHKKQNKSASQAPFI
jgi:hypothetical protein